VSIGQARQFYKRNDTVLWRWDTLDGRWMKLDRDARPGMTLLLRAADGGYDEAIGFDATIKKPPVPAIAPVSASQEEAFRDDERSYQRRPVALSDHLADVADQAAALCTAIGESVHKNSIVRAGRWHDLGKAHKVFDTTMHACEAAPAGFLAKSPCRAHHGRKYFRHELASALGWLAQHEGEVDADLIAYLIAAHHGKVRTSLRAMPDEKADHGVKRFARGVWEGDVLPPLDFDGEHSDETVLKLALMEIGKGEQGPSWAERTLNLLDEYGPFQLAWLETLVRLADWRASAIEQRGASHE
jgi:CRISPR-associated endonuclease/helicase Cas3